MTFLEETEEGQGITYRVSQKVHTLGVETVSKYSALKFVDKLPAEVDYVSAWLEDAAGYGNTVFIKGGTAQIVRKVIVASPERRYAAHPCNGYIGCTCRISGGSAAQGPQDQAAEHHLQLQRVRGFLGEGLIRRCGHRGKHGPVHEPEKFQCGSDHLCQYRYIQR